ncbi:type IV conjugative transfer system protein TraE [Enterococcus mundtii]|uniref:TraE1 n=1 Tax=Enterococcus mundtii TaxID=53346 RepID=A0A242KLK2_ENTMU|nr:type IV conjugative transfer system protein TraE [Enterococcus mundtii]OTP19992.1 traE1 [Enterococcus mundtii]OTP22126.1 traE1 [Enterococcus mundtii]
MSYMGTLSVEDIYYYGSRCTATEKVTKKIPTGQHKTVVQAKRYVLKKDKALEEMVYYIGKQKQVLLKDPISLKELYPKIKYVYDKNGVLIGRRRNGVLRCTAKGMGRLIG